MWFGNGSLEFPPVILFCQAKDSVRMRGDNKVLLRFLNFIIEQN